MNSSQTGRVIAAGMVGNVLEWYDFAIYGYFASAIGRQFFPHEDAVAQLLLAFGVFALGFLMRPIGGAFVGHIGDQFGRRAALTFSVAAMAIPTFLTVAWICDAGPFGAGPAHAVAHGEGTFGWRRIHQFDGVPGRTRARGPPWLNGCVNRVWSGRGHPAWLRSWCGFGGQYIDR